MNISISENEENEEFIYWKWEFTLQQHFQGNFNTHKMEAAYIQ